MYQNQSFINYYPNQSRMEYIGSDGMPSGGIMGPHAHLKTIEEAHIGKVICVNFDSKINKMK